MRIVSTALCTLLFALASTGDLQAQHDSYYWSDSRKIALGQARDAFQSVIRDTRTVVDSQGLESPVDIEVAFRSLKVTENDVWVFSKNKEKQLEIRLATRVIPPSEPQG